VGDRAAPAGRRVGCKFEELLIVDEGRAYWLDDTSQQRITIQP